jgi:photosystem II stability/assembly factor-like uncharacterized protein
MPSGSLAAFVTPARLAGLTVLTIAALIPARWGSAREQDSRSSPTPWRLLLDRPTPGKYEDIAFVGDRNGWIVAAAGDILRTTDGGSSWTVVASRMGSLRSVEFLDAQRGFAGTLGGKLYSTSDSGITWADVTSLLPHAPKGICGIAHVGERVHLVGQYVGAANYYASADGGRSWRHSDLSAVAEGLVDVEFLDDSVGLIGGMGIPEAPGRPGAGVVLKTIDGGKSWKVVHRQEGGRSWVWKLFVVSPSMIYAAVEMSDRTLQVLRSTDAGDSWRVLRVGVGEGTNSGLQGIGFLDAATGWVGGFLRGMYVTHDSGNTWQQDSVPGSTFNRYARAGRALITAGSTGIFKVDSPGLPRGLPAPLLPPAPLRDRDGVTFRRVSADSLAVDVRLDTDGFTLIEVVDIGTGAILRPLASAPFRAGTHPFMLPLTASAARSLGVYVKSRERGFTTPIR